MPNKTILLIESGAAARQHLQAALSRARPDWQVTCVGNAAAASALLAKMPWDAVVSDAQVPVPDAAKFFEKIARLHPQTIRVLRIEAANKGALKELPAPAPKVLPADCTPEILEATLRRAFRLAGWMANPAVRNLIPRMRHAPSLPSLYTMVINELRAPEPDLESVAMYISSDPALCAKLLRLANSAYFGLSQAVSNAFEAAMHLGTERLKSLMLFTHFASQFEATPCVGFSVDQVWQHSLSTAAFARWIMQEEGASPWSADEAFTAGLLHDLGKLILAANWAETYKEVLTLAPRERLPLVQAEHRVLGTTHAEIGACLLAIWELPVDILDALAWHHSPEECDQREFSALTAVHAANALEYEMRRLATQEPVSQLNLDYLKSLSLDDRCDRWRKVCGCLATEEPQTASGHGVTPQ